MDVQCVFLFFFVALIHALQYETHTVEVNLPVYYAEPSSSIKGVLFLFHGCNHNPEDWFLLPAEMTLVRTALRSHFVCLAIPSFDRVGSRCWHPDNDTERVKRVYSRFVSGRWPRVPYYAAGASSGGSYVSYLGNFQFFPLSAIAVYISPGMPDGVVVKKEHAPAIFVHMTEDQHMASRDRVAAYTSKLNRLGVASEVLTCDPKKVTATWMNEYYRPWSPAFCISLTRQLAIKGVIDTEGTLTEDPRNIEDDWIEVMLEVLKPTSKNSTMATVRLHMEVLRELLNIAWGMHEMTGEHAVEVVGFLSSHGN